MRAHATRSAKLSILGAVLLASVAAQAQVPQATLNVPAQAPIGGTVSFSVTFDNTDPTNTGYGPYIDLFLPFSGADGLSGGGPNDGISFVSATYLGSSVTTNLLNCPAGSTVTHPLTGQTIACPAQPGGLYSPFTWQLVVIALPFGSFVPSQPPAEVTVQALVHSFADAGVALPIWANAGFRFGADPLDNPGSDPPIVGSAVSGSTTPSVLLSFEKTYNGPEDETATGPNFPRQYTITATLAPGQTVNNLVVTDTLPPNMQFTSLLGTSPAASCTTAEHDRPWRHAHLHLR